MADDGILKKLAGFVSQAAPLLGSALGSPLAGVALSLMSSAFGGKASTPDELLALLSSDPEAMVKLKELEFKHQEALLQIDAQNFQAAVNDKDSARKMRIALKDHVPDVLAFLFLVIYAGVQYHCIQHAGTGDDMISARCQDIMIMIMSFYFGSAFKKTP
jgi:hypothetical protein